MKVPQFPLLFVLLLVPLTGVVSLDNGLGLTPPMGYNTWNIYRCDIDEDKILAAARALFKLKHLGYVYLNLDDCWMSPNRTTDGKYTADPDRFPSGMKYLGDYLHAMGLKFGIYSSAGTKTCARLPGSLGHEDVDAQTFADWGVDYLKYDNCYSQHVPGIVRYTKMRDALNATGRPIFYSLCNWGTEDSWQWAPTVGNSWRTTGDISPNWNAIRTMFWKSQKHAHRGAGGRGGWSIPANRAWLDPDLLEVGNGLTHAENRAHFSLWCLAKAPLLLSTDLVNMSQQVKDVISNRNLIRINQDPTSPQATCFAGCSVHDPWSILATTTKTTTADPHAFSVVVLVVNWSDDELVDLRHFAGHTVGVVPTPSQVVTIQDLWSNEAVDFDNHVEKIPLPTLQPHGCVVYELTLRQKHNLKEEQNLLQPAQRNS